MLYMVPTEREGMYRIYEDDPPDEVRNDPLMRAFEDMGELKAYVAKALNMPPWPIHHEVFHITQTRWSHPDYYKHGSEGYRKSEARKYIERLRGPPRVESYNKEMKEGLDRVLAEQGYVQFKDDWDAKSYAASDESFVIRTKKYDGLWRVARDPKLVKRRQKKAEEKEKEKVQDGLIEPNILNSILQDYEGRIRQNLPTWLQLKIGSGYHWSGYERRPSRGWGRSAYVTVSHERAIERQANPSSIQMLEDAMDMFGGRDGVRMGLEQETLNKLQECKPYMAGLIKINAALGRFLCRELYALRRLKRIS